MLSTTTHILTTFSSRRGGPYREEAFLIVGGVLRWFYFDFWLDTWEAEATRKDRLELPTVECITAYSHSWMDWRFGSRKERSSCWVSQLGAPGGSNPPEPSSTTVRHRPGDKGWTFQCRCTLCFEMTLWQSLSQELWVDGQQQHCVKGHHLWGCRVPWPAPALGVTQLRASPACGIPSRPCQVSFPVAKGGIKCPHFPCCFQVSGPPLPPLRGSLATFSHYLTLCCSFVLPLVLVNAIISDGTNSFLLACQPCLLQLLSLAGVLQLQSERTPCLPWGFIKPSSASVPEGSSAATWALPCFLLEMQPRAHCPTTMAERVLTWNRSR